MTWLGSSTRSCASTDLHVFIWTHHGSDLVPRRFAVDHLPRLLHDFFWTSQSGWGNLPHHPQDRARHGHLLVGGCSLSELLSHTETWLCGTGRKGGRGRGGVARGSSPLLIGWSHMWLIQFFDLNLLWRPKGWRIKPTAAAETPEVCLSTIRAAVAMDNKQKSGGTSHVTEDEELMWRLMLRNRAAATPLLSVRPREELAAFAILTEETHGMDSPS